MISFPVHNFAPPPFAPLGLHWSPDSPGTLATDWNLLESRTRKTITSPLFHSLQSLMAYYHSIGVCVCVCVAVYCDGYIFRMDSIPSWSFYYLFCRWLRIMAHRKYSGFCVKSFGFYIFTLSICLFCLVIQIYP